MRLFVDSYGELEHLNPLIGTFACAGGSTAMGLERGKEYIFEAVPEGGEFYLEVVWNDCDWPVGGRLYRGDKLIYRFDDIYTGLYDFLSDKEYESVSFNITEVESQ